MIKKIFLLFCFLNVFITVPCIAAGAKRVNIDPRVGNDVLKLYFEHMVTKPNNMKTKLDIPSHWTDKHIFLAVLQQWKACLEESPDHKVSTDCVVENVCNKAAYYHVPNSNRNKTTENWIELYCDRYGRALSETKPKDSDPNCKYNVSKIGAWQESVRYERKSDGTGFIRNGGNTTWRMNNPGNIRKGRNACAWLKVRQSKGECNVLSGELPDNCVFAVYETEEDGWNALEWLLKNGGASPKKYGRYMKYSEQTIDVAMDVYAPSSDANSPKKYACNIKKALYKHAEAKGDKSVEKEGTGSCEAPNFSTGYKKGRYDTVKVGALTDEEIRVFMEEINRHEGKGKGDSAREDNF